MLIQVKLVDGMTSEFDVEETTTVFALKERLAEATGLTPEQLGLVFKGAALKDDQTMSSANIKTGGPPLYMVAQLRGGQW
jgi:hypothetical protein